MGSNWSLTNHVTCFADPVIHRLSPRLEHSNTSCIWNDTWLAMADITRAKILHAIFSRAFEIFGDDNDDWMLIQDLLKMGPEAP